MNEADQEKVRGYLTTKQIECNVSASFNQVTKMCGPIFDGILCWNATPPGMVATQRCPFNHLIVSQHERMLASKKCEDNAEWYVHAMYNKTWTNYTQCGEIFFVKMLVPFNHTDEETYQESCIPILKTVTHLGYTLSIIALVFALAIFVKIKKLRCARNRLHMHLYVSFITRALMSLLKDATFYKGIALASDIIFIEGNPQFVQPQCSWICKVISTVRNYFIIANYMMVLMEGVYLHNLMFLQPFSDNSHITIYYTLGWGVPLLFIIPWIILRIKLEDELCWTHQKTYISLLIQIPIGISVIISFGLFITFLHVLCIKLNKMYMQERTVRYKRLLKSTLILVLLFGAPYLVGLLLSFYAPKNAIVDVIWLGLDQTFASFQGFFAAVIYCFSNKEVRMEIEAKYHLFRNKKDVKRCRTISHTQQISLPLHDEFISRESLTKPVDHTQHQSTHF